MNFLAPLGLFFSLFIPAVIILYILKLKRIDTPIASTLLWKQSMEDLRANSPFQKLKRNLLLFLQLIIITLLTLAVAHPVLRLGGLQGQSYIVMIDNSASMSSTDTDTNRLEEAKKKAVQLINDMSVGDKMMLVEFSSTARVLNYFEQNKGSLRQKVQEIQPTDNPTNIKDAVPIAVSAAEVQPNAEIIIFSDGGFTIPDDSPMAALKTRFVPVGVSSNNVGIVDLVVRRDFGEEHNTQIFTGVQNFSPSQKQVYLELWGIGGRTTDATPTASANARELLDAYQLNLEPGKKDTVIFKDPGSFPPLVELKIDSQDDLAVDNSVMTVIPAEETVNILMVTEQNFYLQRVLNLDHRVRLSIVPPGGYTGPQDFDIVVFDNFAPLQLVNGNYVFINSLPPMPEWTTGSTVTLPRVVDWNRFHPLCRYLTFENLEINECKNIAVPGWAEVIAESRETPLITAFQQKEVRGVVISFDIYDTSWPLRVSFPIFFSNMIDWFVTTSETEEALRRTGDILSLNPPAALTEKSILAGPNGYRRDVIFSENAPQFISDINRAGVYTFTVGEKETKKFAVNLISPGESDIAPKTTLNVGTAEIEGDVEAVTQNREIWRYLAVIALIIAMVEWMVYVKRARFSV